jgi:hypothetical protein
MNWKQVQPQEQVFRTEPIDEWVEHLGKRRMPLIAGPLIRLDHAGVPDWMVIWEHDFDMLREMAYDFVQKIVQRYRKGVAVWNVAAGLQSNAAFSLTFEQIIELTRLLVSQVKTLLPGARTLITITQPFGEYHARGRQSVAPMLYAEMIANAGINFEAFGLEIELGVPGPGTFTRDLFQLSTLLDRFATLGRPVFLTAMGVPGRSTPDGNDISEGTADPAAAGRWRRPWDPQLQADWMDAVYHMALSKPFVESIAWSNLADLHPSLPGGGLLDDLLQPKPAFQKVQQLREKFRQFQVRRPCGFFVVQAFQPALWVGMSGPSFDRGHQGVSDNPRSPDPKSEAPAAFALTLPQRRALLFLLSILFIILAARLACNPTFVSNPQPERPPRFDQLADRLDPNTADVNDLIALPTLGEKRAEAIVEFREKQRARGRPEPIFHTAEDLLAIKGFGPATVDTMRPYLTFPPGHSSTTSNARVKE